MRKRSPRPELPKKRARTTASESSSSGSSDAFTCTGFFREALSAGPLASARRDSGRAVVASKLESKVILLDNAQSKGSAAASFGAVRLRERRRQAKHRPRLSRRRRRALGLDLGACFDVKGGVCNGVADVRDKNRSSGDSGAGSSPLTQLTFADTLQMRRLWISYFTPLLEPPTRVRLQEPSVAGRDDISMGSSTVASTSAQYDAQNARHRANTFAAADLHGCEVRVRSAAAAQSLAGTQGVLVLETAHAFLLLTPDDEQYMVPKQGTELELVAGGKTYAFDAGLRLKKY